MSKFIPELFDLRTDQAESEVIDDTIRTNVKVVGTNLWVLIFAILVASVGLNVNSTAVIIGAMLISPLMGPIVGLGYGMGINDLSLIKLSLRNLAIFTFISIVASTFYFIISPLDTAQSELLARTSPTIWDVLIAFFGGSAGIIATTRKSISNVVPGVAIATALMPPLCTAGFGIAQGNWTYFGGAFFLYTINSVFIALSTLLFVNLFHLPKRHYVDEKTEKRNNILIGLTVLLMVIPSTYLAYNLVKQNRFTQSVNQYITTSSSNNDFVLLGRDINPQKQEVVLTLGGANAPDKIETALENKLKQQGFDNVDVKVKNSGTSAVELSNLKSELTQDLYTSMVQQVGDLTKENQRLQTELTKSSQLLDEDKKLFAEIKAQYPIIKNVTISRGERFIENNEPQPLITIKLGSTAPLSKADQTRIEKWLAVKYDKQTVDVAYETVTAEQSTPQSQSN